ncbi:MAG: PIG-L family deacetylase [Deltaproteobacteria bacterium]|nr:PIG-L family deacetylase [Deltaproteobacteria bacterium]
MKRTILALLVASVFVSCAGYQKLRRPIATPLDNLLELNVRIMWVAAHPDDESIAGPILSKAAAYGDPIYMLVLNHGDGGECNLPEGCLPTLADVRGKELAKVAELYGATLQHEWYWNAPLPTETFPKRHEIARKWRREGGDPTVVVAKAIRDFRPDVVFALSPIRGGTGHPEHQLAGRFAMAGVRLAASGDADLPGKPYRVPHCYHIVNKAPLFRLFGLDDPLPYTERFDVRQPCKNGMTCAETGAENTKPHRTQIRDMGAMRKILKLLDYLYLYRIDPFTEVLDPYEPVEEGGMT